MLRHLFGDEVEPPEDLRRAVAAGLKAIRREKHEERQRGKAGHRKPKATTDMIRP